MKRFFPFIIIAVISITMVTMFTSCNKEYTCNCSYTDASGIDRVNTGSFTGSKSKARKACEDNEDYLNTIATNVYCEL